MFLGWYDPDKKTPARYKLEDALERYARKFGRPAQTCITSPEDAAELEADREAPTMPVRGAGFIPRYTFYVGIDEEAVEVVRPVAGDVLGTGERKSVRRKPPVVDSGHEGTTTAAKTRRNPMTKSTAAPAPKPRAKHAGTDPVVNPGTKRPKSDSGVQPGAARATADPVVQSKTKPAKADQGLKSGTNRLKTNSETNPGLKPKAKPAKPIRD